MVDEGWGAPASNADAFRALNRHGALDPITAGQLASANGLRNVLVHGYAEVDDDQVREALADLDRFDAFLAQVSTWVARQL